MNKGNEGLATFYRRMLADEVMPFWTSRTLDREQGGFFTCFDREGKCVSTDKFVWMQGRNLWMYSALFNRFRQDPKYLEGLAKACSFLIRHAYAGHGRWNYALDRDGNVLRGVNSIFTDLFMLAGLCEYSVAAGTDEYSKVIDETLCAVLNHFDNPAFKDLYHGKWMDGMIQHGQYMTTLDVLTTSSAFVGLERVIEPMRRCLHRILFQLTNNDEKALFEAVKTNGMPEKAPESRVLNPGHALESMWFCIEAGHLIHDEKLISRAVEIADWMFKRGFDSVNGGLFTFLDADGGEPLKTGWNKETAAQWDDKVWWVHAEALHTLLLCHYETREKIWFERFQLIHDFSWKHFYDPVCHEWYSSLKRDGSIKDSAKGSEWKAAYHLPRALLAIIKLFEKLNEKSLRLCRQ